MVVHMNRTRKKNKIFSYKSIIHMIFCGASFFAIVPFILLVVISFSYEDDVLTKGYLLFPQRVTTDAYRFIFRNIGALLQAYKITIIYAVFGTLIGMIVMAMIGYALSRDNFVLKKPITVILLITMFFSGGLIPSYLLHTQILHLGNNILLYLVSGMVGAYTVFVLKSFFQQIPKSLIEAAQIDGASEPVILCRIMVPLSLPVLATFGFMGLVQRWNDFTVPMYYMTDPDLYTLQYMLQNVLNEAEYLKELQKNMPTLFQSTSIPSETMKFAMCVLASGPMLVVFPFFQKYFSKGMIVGAVKG